jgi:hypothetical protein
MKIAVLSHKPVASRYAATLIERGHQVITPGVRSIYPSEYAAYLQCHGCLLLGEEHDLLEIAARMQASGKQVWEQLPNIRARSSSPTPQRRGPKWGW